MSIENECRKSNSIQLFIEIMFKTLKIDEIQLFSKLLTMNIISLNLPG